MKKENKSLIIAALISLIAAFSLSIKAQSTINSYTFTTKFLQSDFQQLYEASRIAAPTMTLPNSMTTYTFSRPFNQSDNQQLYNAIRGIGDAITTGTANSWNITGNSLTSGTEFLGSTNAMPLYIKTNNTTAATIGTNQAVNFVSSVTTPSLYGSTTNSVLNIFSNINGNGTINIGTGFGTFISNNQSILGNNQKLRVDNTGVYNYGTGTYSTNTIFGVNAMSVVTTGDGSSAFGYGALQKNTTGFSNNAFGYNALFNNISGTNNTAIGLQSLYTHTAGNSNTAMGNASLYSDINGAENSAFGGSSLYSNTNGNFNCAFGVASSFSNTSGSKNVAFGYNSLQNVTTGSNNIGIGYGAGVGITTGSNNVIIGSNISSQTATTTNNIIIANGAGSIKYRHNGTNFTLTANTETLTAGNSGTIATLSDALFTTTHFHGLATIGTTTVFWDKYPSSSGTSNTSGAVGVTVLPFNCKLVGFSLSISVLGTLGTANTASVYARINNTTDVLLTSSALYSSAASYYSASNLSQLITAGDRIEIKVVPNVTPTNATNVTEAVTLYYSRN